MVNWHVQMCCAIDEDSYVWQVLHCYWTSDMEHAASFVVFGGQYNNNKNNNKQKIMCT